MKRDNVRSNLISYDYLSSAGKTFGAVDRRPRVSKFVIALVLNADKTPKNLLCAFLTRELTWWSSNFLFTHP